LLKHGLSYIITEKTTTTINGQNVELIKGRLNAKDTIRGKNDSSARNNKGGYSASNPRGDSSSERAVRAKTSRGTPSTSTKSKSTPKSQPNTSKSVEKTITKQELTERVDDFSKADNFVSAFKNKGWTRPQLLEIYQKEKRRLRNRSLNQKKRDAAAAKPSKQSVYELQEEKPKFDKKCSPRERG
jgi:hypothetical protein